MARRRGPSYTRGTVQSALGAEVSVVTKQFARHLRQLRDNDTRRAMVAAGRKAVEIAEREVRRRTPVGDRPKRGRRLKDTVKGQVTASSIKLKVGSKKNFHAWFVHEGHKTRGSGFVAGRPFIREGISEAYSDFLDVYIQEISKVIDDFNRKE